MGTETAKLFEKELGIKSLGDIKEDQSFIASSDKIGAIRSSLLSVELQPGTKAVANFYTGSDFRDKGKLIAASVNDFGNGKIAGVYFNAGSNYIDYKSPVLRDFISDLITKLFPDQVVNVSGSHLVHVAVNQLNNKMYVNLVNIAGEHSNPSAVAYDEIPALKDLKVSIKTIKRPARIVLQPEGKDLKFDYQNGVSKVVVSNLPIHSILEIIP
jgi:hypothetical protein